MPGASNNGAPQLRDQTHLPRANFPPPMGLPHLPGMRASWPPRPAGTGHTPPAAQDPSLHPQISAQATGQQPLPIQNIVQYGTTMGPIPHTQQNFGQFPQMQAQMQGFLNPQNYGAPFTHTQPPQFNMPFPGLPVPWMPGQNWPPQNHLPHDNTTNPHPGTHGNTNQGTQSFGQQPASNPETILQPSTTSTHNQEQSNTTATGPASTTNGNSSDHGPHRPEGAQNAQAPLGQWRISINQTTFHTPTPVQPPNTNPPQNTTSAQGSQTNFIPNFPRSELANMPPAQRLERLQQLRNQVFGADTGPQPRSSTPPSTLAYLLSSPTGPQALLVTSAGSFATAGYNPSVSHLPILRAAIQPQQAVIGSSLGSARNTQPQPPQVPGQAPPPNGPLPVQMNQQPPPQRRGQRRDIRIAIPLGAHFWLLVRLCGLVYLFSSDRGWRNVFLLGLCAFILFAAQTRVFEPLLEYVWNPIRRHIEGVIQIDQQQPAQAAPTQHEEANAETYPPGSPEELAQRLVQERRARQNENPLRRPIARVERFIALFLASLVPGVGEQHVAARQEVTRQEREREETARREEEDRQRQAERNIQGVPEEGKQTAQENKSTDAAGQVLDGIAEEVSTDTAT